MVAPKAVGRIKDLHELWLGERFAHSVEPQGTKVSNLYSNIKAIVPVKSTYQTGLHMSGACNLDYPYNGCESNHKGLCFEPNNTRSRAKMMFARFYTDHYVDERVRQFDAKKIDMNEQGCMYHMLLNRMHLRRSNQTNMTAENDYKAKYFPAVMTELRRRQLDLLIDIPESVSASTLASNSKYYPTPNTTENVTHTSSALPRL